MSALAARMGPVQDYGVTEIEIPMPPSINRFIAKLGNRSPIVKAWIKQADAHFVMTRRSLLPIKGAYELEIILSAAMRNRHPDLGNREKALSDWLQRVGLIENDNLCEKMTIHWGWAPVGCRVKLRAWSA